MGWMDEMAEFNRHRTRRTPEQILYPIGMIMLLALGVVLCIIMGNCITTQPTTQHEINFITTPQSDHPSRGSISGHGLRISGSVPTAPPQERLVQSRLSTPYIVDSIRNTPCLWEISGRCPHNLGVASNFTGYVVVGVCNLGGLTVCGCDGVWRKRGGLLQSRSAS